MESSAVGGAAAVVQFDCRCSVISSLDSTLLIGGETAVVIFLPAAAPAAVCSVLCSWPKRMHCRYLPSTRNGDSATLRKKIYADFELMSEMKSK